MCVWRGWRFACAHAAARIFLRCVALRSARSARRRRKYLIPMDLTVGQFVYVIRKRISIPSDKAIFIFVNNTLPPTAALMSAVYEQHRDEDGFMCARQAASLLERMSPSTTRRREPAPAAVRVVRCGSRLPCPAALHRYMMYSGENTFGAFEMNDALEALAAEGVVEKC